MEDIEIFFHVFTLVIAFSALGLSILDLILRFLDRKKTQDPTIKISAKTLPPYENPEGKTEIILENTGTAKGYLPTIYVEYSYDEGDTFFEFGQDFINVSEIIKTGIQLLDPPKGKSTIEIVAMVSRSRKRRTVLEFRKEIKIEN